MVRYMEYGRTPLFYDSDILWSICALHQRFLIGVIGSKEDCVKNIKADIKMFYYETLRLKLSDKISS